MIKHLNVKSVATLAAGVVAASLSVPLLASAGTENSRNFGCSKGDRTMGATTYYSAFGANQWLVTKVNYSYSNSGGGKANSSFRVNAGDNSVAWTYDTPDNRTNKSYSKAVKKGKGKNKKPVTILRGEKARIWQKTWFDTFGRDPRCSKSSRFAL